MFLKTIRLTNFRNFSHLEFDFNNATLIIGSNAQGKSNLLESIYFLATTKSPRVEKDVQLIKQNESFCKVGGEVISENQKEEVETTKLEIAIQKIPQKPEVVEKKVKLNGLPKRALDYVGNLVAVYFSPEDIHLVTGAPSSRRLYLDLTLSQIDRDYKKAFSSYTAVLASRNKLLKRIREGLSTVDELDFWTQQLIASGALLQEKRKAFFEFVNNTCEELTKTVGSFGRLQFIYQQNLITKERLHDYQDKEIAAAATLIGPHRDDFIFMLDGMNLAYFGSRGQQRMAVLDLKLAELQFINKVKNITPVLLLDDIFSELDEVRRAYVISVISGFQTILSAIETEHIPDKFLQEVKILRLEGGKTI